MSSENPRPEAKNIERNIVFANGPADLCPAQLFCPRLDWILLHIDLADMYLSSVEIIPDDKTRSNWVHDPVQHTDAIADDRSEIGVEMDGHHGLI